MEKLCCTATYNLSMTQEAHELLRKALALPENERAELAGNLISSLETTVDTDVDAAWQDEVARRAQEVQSGKVKTIPWEAVQQEGPRAARWQVSRFDFIQKRKRSI